MPEHHSLAPIGGAGGEAQIGRAKRAEGGVLGQLGSLAPAEQEAGLVFLDDLAQPRAREEGFQHRTAAIVRDRNQTGAGGQYAERQLDEAPPLSRQQAAAVAGPHALGAQPLGVRFEDRHQLGGADDAAAALAVVDAERRLLGRPPRLLADPVDDRHGSPRAASSRILRFTSRGATSARAAPVSAASAAAIPMASPVASAVPTTRSAPSASWLAERQRPAMPSRGCERLTSAPSGIEQAPAGYSNSARRWSCQSSIGQVETATSSSRARPSSTSARESSALPTSRRVSRTPIRRGQASMRLLAKAGRVRRRNSATAAALARARCSSPASCSGSSGA